MRNQEPLSDKQLENFFFCEQRSFASTEELYQVGFKQERRHLESLHWKLCGGLLSTSVEEEVTHSESTTMKCVFRIRHGESA